LPVLVIVGLVVLVAYMAARAPSVDPNAGQRQSLPPDVSVPATGAAFPPSPAMANGSPQMSAANQLRLMTNFKYADANLSRLAMSLPALAAGTKSSTAIGPTQADSSLATQDVPPTVGYKIPGAGIKLNTDALVRKL